MKTGIRRIFTSSILIISSYFTIAQTILSPDSKEFIQFQQNVEKWKDAYNSGDAQNLIPLYSEDAIYSSSHVPGLEAIGLEKLIANFQKGASSGGHIDKIEILSANLSKDMASLYCKYQATNSGVTVSGRNLLVLRNVKGKWLIFIHMTVV